MRSRMAKKLSKRQEAMLSYIEQFIEQHSYPPTIRDIQRDLDISSTSVVDYNLNALEQRNFIRRNRNISRGIELVGRHAPASNLVKIPIVGQIAAGEPIPVLDDVLIDENTETIELSGEMIGSRNENLFGLRVRGMSMIDALINDGDIVILRHQKTCENGETVAVWLRDEKETTLKKFYLEQEQIRLQPANAQMDPIYCDPENVEIQGKLVTVFRPYA
jgi:repressor LexA